MPVRVQRTIRAQFEAGNSREETLQGRSYYVVPVIAMVEGVRFGANQEGPELGLATEFGDVPIVWAYKPLVLNHPQDEDGTFVSANSPNILESYQFGWTMNPEVKDSKLHMEAWIDVARVEELGGEFETTLQRIKDQETVEVSVGFFSDIQKQKGKYKGQTYNAIWRNIKPDHLAVLSEGILGACSVADGCGVPRINQKDGDMPTPIVNDTGSGGCQCGGNCGCNKESSDASEVQPQTQSDKPKPRTSVPSVQSDNPLDEAHIALRQQNTLLVEAHIKSLKVSGDMLSSDVSKLVGQALRKKYGSGTYLYGYTSEFAVFELYDMNTYSYVMKKIGINVDNDKVEFVGDPEEVVLLTKIVSTQETNQQRQQENNMSDNKGNGGASDQQTQQTPSTPTTQSAPTPPAPAVQEKKLMAQEYIDQAPAEIREVLQSASRVHQERKDGFIKTLRAAPGNKFEEAELKAMSLDMLEKLAGLLPASFGGIATPSQPTFQNQQNSDRFVEAPKVFEFKKPEQAA